MFWLLKKKKISENFIDKIFDSIWVDDLNLNSLAVLEKVLKNMNVNPKNFLDETSNQIIKDELKDKTNKAFSKGIFGCPSFLINNKIFWGQDRLEFVFNEAKK